MRKEFIIWLVISGGILLLANWALITGAKGGEDWVFLLRGGIHYDDVYPDVSLIEQAKNGGWTVKNLYSSNGTDGVLPLFILSGKIALISGVSPLNVYHGLRITLGLGLSGVIYLWAKHIFRSSQGKWLTLVLVMAGSGLGYWVGRWTQGSADLKFPESMTFLTLRESPQMILAGLLMAGIGYAYVKNKPVWVTGLLMCLVTEKPFSALVVMITIFVAAWWNNEERLRWWLAVIPALLVWLLRVQFINANPIWEGWFFRLGRGSLDPNALLMGFGLILPLMLVGAERLLRLFPKESKYLLVWIGVSLAVAFFPGMSGTGAILGIHIPMAILSGAGLMVIGEGWETRWFRQMARWSLVLVVCVSSFYAVNREVGEMKRDTDKDYTFNIMAAEVEGIKWLKDNVKPSDTVLSNWFFGNIIPGVTGRRVYVGHYYLTDNYEGKLADIDDLINSGDPNYEKDFLKKNNITYIYTGEEDEITMAAFKPEERGYLQKVYDKNNVRIYKVKVD